MYSLSEKESSPKGWSKGVILLNDFSLTVIWVHCACEAESTAEKLELLNPQENKENLKARANKGKEIIKSPF